MIARGEKAQAGVLERQALARKLLRLIDATGPISIAAFMAEANGHYYATRDPFGAAGDFITAPEISQMFGELIGLWCADLWLRAGKPDPVHYVELGPGRGTLAMDALRAMEQVGLRPSVHFVEMSPVLRGLQAEAVADATFHNDVASLPSSGALLLIANEFFDALPVRQLVMTGQGWRERMVAEQERHFLPVAGQIPMDAAVPADLRRAAVGTILETCPSASAIMHDLAARLAVQGGAMLTIDYGYEGPQAGDTLQALYRHKMVSPFDNVGEQDLTAHVDFSALADAARSGGVQVAGPVEQGAWLKALGLEARAQKLIAARPDQADTINGQVARLAGGDQMGRLFKILAGYAPRWPVPEGFGL